ncbi:unnamed protein product [Vitrella brassicaformis CCMP3155]|uniref:HD/PDEase domain-containing protein n=2 Tax=Vitrella brassicaformis TaxID=1169539 RepID=A0A0G4G0Z5_VITBC|nr:unnamed protein product [Vitrella brassicaformis CCMP3155]|eukprot:CEM21646.1 unnamed protein product [Vitrella brassicaformis CCMP3155]
MQAMERPPKRLKAEQPTYTLGDLLSSANLQHLQEPFAKAGLGELGTLIRLSEASNQLDRLCQRCQVAQADKEALFAAIKSHTEGGAAGDSDLARWLRHHGLIHIKRNLEAALRKSGETEEVEMPDKKRMTLDDVQRLCSMLSTKTRREKEDHLANWVESPVDLCKLVDLLDSVPPKLTDKTVRTVSDRIYDSLSFDRELFSFIDTPQVQRLRRLKQLGACHLVYPGAVHTRFEHSLGVAYLSKKAFELLAVKAGVSLSDPRVVRLSRLLQIAGLCHDLGHGPMSHTFEFGLVRKLPGLENWCHEDMSLALFDDMIATNPKAAEVIDALDGRQVVKDFIQGSRPEDRPFVKSGAPIDALERAAYDIVANKRNGLDTDRMDYLQRDASISPRTLPRYNPDRLLSKAMVIDGEICYPSKEVQSVVELYQTRYSLFKKVYTHSKVIAQEHMVCGAINAAKDSISFIVTPKGGGERKRMTVREIIEDGNCEGYLYLTDSLEDMIRGSDDTNDPGLQEAKSLFLRLEQRDIYRVVGEHFIDKPIDEVEKHMNEDNISRIANSRQHTHLDGSQGAQVSKDDIIVDVRELHHGTGERNPLHNVGFYKHGEKGPKKIQADSPSSPVLHSGCHPRCWQEIRIVVLLKDPHPTKFLKVQGAFTQILNEKFGCPHPVHEGQFTERSLPSSPSRPQQNRPTV